MQRFGSLLEDGIAPLLLKKEEVPAAAIVPFLRALPAIYVNLPAQMLRTMDGASKTPAVSQTFV